MKKEKMSSSSMGALIEYFDGKFNLLIDGYAALDKKIDDLRMDMQARFKDIEERLNAIERRLDAMEERFSEMDSRLEVVFEELHDLHKEPSAR